jgi:MFS family permease
VQPAHRILAVAVLTIVVGSLPVWLVGSLAFQITEDLRFSADSLGLAVATFFGASAVCSVPAGRMVQRWGPGVGMASTALLGGCSLVGLGTSDSLAALLVWIGLAGIANSTCQPSANVTLTRESGLLRQGLAFGIKQAAIPASTLVAGLAVPLVALTVGWRWAFVAATGGPLVLLVIAIRGGKAPGKVARLRHPRTRAVRPLPMLVLALAGGLGAAAANSFGAFVVASAISSGVSAGAAGSALAVGSLAGIGARVLWGWSADRRDGGHLRVVAFLMVSGAALLAGLAVAREPGVLVVLVVAMYCLGWGWPGLYSFAIVARNPTAAASASGFLMSGIYAGGVAGPLAFGLIVHRHGFDVAWLWAAATLGCAAALVSFGRHLLRLDARKFPSPALARL